MATYTPDIGTYTVGAGIPTGWSMRADSGNTTADVAVISVTTPVGDRAISIDPPSTAYRVLVYDTISDAGDSDGRVDVLVCGRRMGTVTGRDMGLMVFVDTLASISGRLATIAVDELQIARINGEVFSYMANTPVSQPAVETWWWLRAQFDGTAGRASWSTDPADLELDGSGVPSIGWLVEGSASADSSSGGGAGLYARAEDEVQYAYFSVGTAGDLAADPSTSTPSSGATAMLWNGTSFVESAPIQRWDGAAWVAAPDVNLP